MSDKDVSRGPRQRRRSRSAVTVMNRIEKALLQMNLQLHLVISDLAGATGLRILRDIVNGQTDPQRLAAHRDIRGKASEAEIVAALTGHYRTEHVPYGR